MRRTAIAHSILTSSYSLYRILNIVSVSTIKKLIAEHQLTLYDFLYDTPKLYSEISNKSALIQKVQTYLNTLFPEEFEKKHIYHLASTGLSLYNIRLLDSVGVHYDDLKTLTLPRFLELTKQEVRESTYTRIMEAYHLLEGNPINTQKEIQVIKASVQELTKEEKLHAFLNAFQPATKFTEQQILEAIPSLQKEDINIFLKLDLLSKEGLWYRKKYEVLNVYIHSISHLKYFDILEGRLAGKSLQELASEQNVSRQSISNREKVIFSKIPFIEEEAKYKELFENLKLSKDFFCELFDETEQVYHFLSIRLTKGIKDILNYIDQYPFSDKQKAIIINRTGGYINHKNKITTLSKLNVFEDVLFYYGKNTISDEKLFIKYNEHISKSNYALPLAENASELRGLHERSYYALQDRSHTYRYFNVDQLDESEIKHLKSLLDLPHGIYSMIKIFDMHRDFLTSIDIRNGYELHNLYKRFIHIDNIEYTRMPEFSVGKTDKSEFIKHIFFEQAPIHIDKFIKYVYEMYGLKETSLKSYIQANLFEYLVDDIIKVEYTELSNEELEYIQQLLLQADIHTIEEIVSIGSLKYNDFADRFINNMVLNKLGYTIRSQFILTNLYRSVERYFTDLILSKDYFKNERLPVNRTQNFWKVIYDLEKNLQIFKVEPDTYITLSKLQAVGVLREDFVDFQKKVKEAVEGLPFFTLDMLKIKGFTHKLLDLGFENLFYDRILWADPELRAITLVAGYIFAQQKEDVSLVTFLKWLITHHDSIEAYDLLDEIKTIYHLEIDLQKIILSLQNTEIYYSPELMKFYSDKKFYFEEIYN